MISHKYKCIFIRIPKTASSSIIWYFIKYLEGVHPERVNNLYIMRGQGLAKTINLFPTYWTFTFVRNPFDRFISCWLDRFDPTRVKPSKLRYHTVHEYIELAADVLSNMKLNPESLKELGPHKVSFKHFGFDRHHLLPQEDFLLDYHPKLYFGVKRFNDVGCSFIGRYENLTQDFKCLLDILDAPHYPMLQKNISTNRLVKNKRKHYSSYYDKASRRLIEDLYARDLDILNYEFEKEGVVSILNPLCDFNQSRIAYHNRIRLPTSQRMALSIQRINVYTRSWLNKRISMFIKQPIASYITKLTANL